MKNYIALATLLLASPLFSDEGPVCHRCELIREYNASHPENNYYWYDDYLKEKCVAPQANQDKKQEPQVSKETSK